MTGKAAIYGESGFDRRSHEAYWTEPWVTKALLSCVSFRGSDIWEPACGRGDMVKELRGCGYSLIATDIEDHGYDGFRPHDFLSGRLPHNIGCQTFDIVTNPPYGIGGRLAREFINMALFLTEPKRGMVAMLLRNEYDSAATRRPIFADHSAFAQKIVLTSRPRWAWWERGTDKASPRHNYAWYIWDWHHEGPPILTYAGRER